MSYLSTIVAVSVPQRIAEQRHGQERGHQEYAGDHHGPPALCQQRLLRQREHAAPRDDLQRQAEAEKAQRRLGQDRALHVHDHHEEDRGEEIRREMLPQDVEKSAAHAPRGQHIFARAQAAHLGADDLGDPGPAGDADDERQRPDRGRAENGL